MTLIQFKRHTHTQTSESLCPVIVMYDWIDWTLEAYTLRIILDLTDLPRSAVRKRAYVSVTVRTHNTMIDNGSGRSSAREHSGNATRLCFVTICTKNPLLCIIVTTSILSYYIHLYQEWLRCSFGSAFTYYPSLIGFDSRCRRNRFNISSLSLRMAMENHRLIFLPSSTSFLSHPLEPAIKVVYRYVCKRIYKTDRPVVYPRR